MVNWRFLSKNPTYGKIGSAKVYSRMKILGAGVSMGLSAIFIQSNQILGISLALLSALLFVWDIGSQTKSAIDVEKRISDLEKSVKESKEKLDKFENRSDTKSDNQ
jgi:hypothetical protein